MRFVEFIRLVENASYTSQSYNVRVKQGLDNEDKVIAAMQKPPCNLKTRKGSIDEDHNGIDCWITLGGMEHSAQIKQRLSGGSDFHYEAYSDYDTPNQKPGRDTRVKAEFFAIVSDGRLYLVKTSQVRSVVTEILKKADYLRSIEKTAKNNKYKPGHSVLSIDYKGVNCEVRQQPDQSSGRAKLLVYMPLDLFELFHDVYTSRIAI